MIIKSEIHQWYTYDFFNGPVLQSGKQNNTKKISANRVSVVSLYSFIISNSKSYYIGKGTSQQIIATQVTPVTECSPNSSLGFSDNFSKIINIDSFVTAVK